MTKYCSGCDQDLNTNCFGKNKATKDGLQPYCLECRKSYYREHKEEILASQQEYYVEHKDEKIDSAVKWKKANPERYAEIQRNHSWKKAGVNDFVQSDYDGMFIAQGGVCAICGGSQTIKYKNKLRQLDVDHDHITGEPRALLCNICNQKVGLYENYPGMTELILKYLNNYQLTLIDLYIIQGGFNGFV